MKKQIPKLPFLLLFLLGSFAPIQNAKSQCTWHTQFFDGFEYTTPCPDILTGLVYTTVPQAYSVHSGAKSLYLNFVNCTTATGAGACVGDTVYRRTISVCPNVPMRISSWYTTTFSGGQCNMHITITDGNNVVLKNTPSLLAPFSPQWVQYQSGQFTPTTNTIKLIMLTNVAGGNGNDLSMDDILVEQCNHLNVGSDTTVCNTQVITLSPGAFNSYLWNTGSTGASIQASTSISGNSVKYYYVDVVDTNGCTYRDSIKINFTVCSFIPDIGKKTLQVFPNPANGQLNIVSNFISENTYLIISDVSGRELQKIKIDQISQTIKLHEWSNGTYLYRLIREGELMDAGKIINNRN
ncbi:MAG: T9SS type A sorting domain-containing protein [Bacteroidetes bacterium]|nr:T9SS type A sorting domain-containing protein [Bacteroidota bacterium]